MRATPSGDTEWEREERRRERYNRRAIGLFFVVFAAVCALSKTLDAIEHYLY